MSWWPTKLACMLRGEEAYILTKVLRSDFLGVVFGNLVRPEFQNLLDFFWQKLNISRKQFLTSFQMGFSAMMSGNSRPKSSKCQTKWFFFHLSSFWGIWCENVRKLKYIFLEFGYRCFHLCFINENKHFRKTLNDIFLIL